MKPIEPYTPKALLRTWGTELFFAETSQYLGKVLTMRAGTKGGLQYHVEKDETFHLLSGLAWVIYDHGGTEPTCCAEWDCGHETGCPMRDEIESPNPGTTLVKRKMHPGESYHIPIGAPHQVEAITDCVLVEASTPHYDDRVRCEEAYGLVFDGGLGTTR